MSPSPENLPDKARGVREELKKLKSQVEANIEGESDVEREKRIAAQLDALLPHIQALHKARQEMIEDNPTAATSEKYKQYLGIERELLADAFDTTAALTAEEVLEGLTDGGITIGSAEEMVQQLDKTKAELFDDELAALEAVMTFGEKVSEKVESALERFGLGERLSALGISMSYAVEFVLNYIAQMGDGYAPLRGFSMNIREYLGVKKANAEGLSKETIIKGKKEWNKAYAEWMKKDSASAGPPPDLYAKILEANEGEEQTAADAEQEQKNKEIAEKFKQHALAEGFFPGATEISAGGSESSAEKIASGGWKITIADGAFKEDGLEETGENLKELFIATNGIANTSKIVLADSFAIKGNGSGGIEIHSPKLDDDLTKERIENATTLTLGNNINSVVIGTTAINATTPFAKLENNILSINYEVMDRTNQTDLLTIVNDETSGNKKWEYKSGAWVEQTA